MRWILVAAMLFAGALPGASAQTAYVTDVLRLGLHRAQDTSDRAFESLVSGAELEVLERVPNYARVRTEDGREGWVKSAYLVAEPPARYQLAQLTEELETARKRLAATEAALLVAQQETDQLRNQIETRNDSNEAIQSTLARLKQQNNDYETRLERYRGSVPITWAGAALLVSLIGGFVAGLWWLDSAIRRRHGGFRVY